MADVLSEQIGMCSTMANSLQSNIVGGDVCVKIVTFDVINGSKREEWILAHRTVLVASSSYLCNLVQAARCSNGLMPTLPTVELNFGFLPNAARAFKIILDFLYTGEFHLESLDPLEVLQVSKICQISAAEAYLSSLVAQNIMKEQKEKARSQTGAMLSLVPSLAQVDLKLMLALQFMRIQQSNPTAQLSSFNPFCETMPPAQNSAKALSLPSLPNFSSFANFVETSTNDDAESCESFANLRSLSSVSTPRSSGSGVESLVPSNDKEGWCRNKKYIERVPSGFMCTVCRKIYGRYNSVSYHVTIYHRNPPIKCDEEGCQFTTREARYIHFHKYYRHHIALPDSIDLGSRKCPFCRHVSKSPAMLEKHISRHMPNCSRVGRSLRCPQCPASADSQSRMQEHVLAHQANTFQCTQCNYKGRTSKNLEQHNLFKHSQEMFKKMLQCPECAFKCSNEEGLFQHGEQMHKNPNPDSEAEKKNDVSQDRPMRDTESAGPSAPSILEADENEDQDEPVCLVKKKKK